MGAVDVTRRAFLAGAGTVLASLTVPLAGPAAVTLGEEASATAAAAAPEAGKIVIIGTNDVHGSFKNPVTKLGYAALADFAAAQRQAYGAGNVTLVDSGDIVQGNPAASLTEGEFPAQAVGACGYDVIAPGNHEFDYGIDRLREIAATEGAAYTCCNFTDAKGNCVFEPYHVVEYPTGTETVRIAYVGVTTPTTRGSSATFKNEAGDFIYDFAIDDTGEKLYATVQAAVDDARDAGRADYVVLLAHLGQSWSPQIWQSNTLVANTNGIDAVIDAHTHQMYLQGILNKDGDTVPVVQAGSKFIGFSKLEIDLAARTATASVVATGVMPSIVDSWDGSDAEVAALTAGLDAQIDQMVGEEIGSSEVDLVALAADGSQATWLGETNLGDFIADAILDSADKAGIHCDVALYDGFGICADIPRGAVTRRSALDALACNRKVYALEVSGQHLLDVLEVACAFLPEPDAHLLQVSDGFAYTVRTDIPTPVVVSPATNGFERIDGERRVMSASLNGQVIDPEGRYAIAMQKGMLVTGGWSMPVPDNADDAVLIGTDNECLLNYVQGTLGGMIGEEYGDAGGMGRITIVDHVDSEEGAQTDKADNGVSTQFAVAAGIGVAAIAAGVVAVKTKQK
ncbi:MAG: 5'-nucleotidase C-terminal domain-containing protein [Coriobacteriia bacterium]|nr:5'-nucleotidase C-terminal domain-containing protein [Coriobacteriia bacterium]